MIMHLELDEIFGGYSGARIFKFQLDGIDYCLKVPKRQITMSDIIRFQEICRIYQQAKIKSLDFLGYGHYGNIPRFFYLYRYIPGDNLDILSKQTYDLSKTYQVGVNAGRALRELKKYPLSDIPSCIPTENIDELTERGNQLYTQLLQTPHLYDALQRFYDLEQLQILIEKFNHAAPTFRTLAPTLIHGDIKCSNLIIDNTGEQHFIDIAAMKISYDVLNFHHQMTWNLLPENHRRRTFTQGFFDGLYDYTRPENFQQQVIYVAMLHFLEHTIKFSHDSQEIAWYFRQMRPVFTKLLTDQNLI